MGRIPEEAWPPLIGGPITYDAPLSLISDLDFEDEAVQLSMVLNMVRRSGLPNVRILESGPWIPDQLNSIFPFIFNSDDSTFTLDRCTALCRVGDITEDLLRTYDVINLPALSGTISENLLRMCAHYRTLLVVDLKVAQQPDGGYDRRLNRSQSSQPALFIEVCRDDDGFAVRCGGAGNPFKQLIVPSFDLNAIPLFSHEILPTGTRILREGYYV